MSCSYEEDLSAYIDGELPEVRAHAMKAHIEGCAECRMMEALIRRTVKAAHEAPRFEPSADLRRRVLRSVAEQRPPLWRMILTPRLFAPVAAAAALGVIVFAVAGRGEDIPELVVEPAQVELAMNYDEVENLDVLGMERPEDLDVISELHELARESP